MDISEVQPVLNEPVLFIKNKKILVVADLHIGIESELREKGISQPLSTENTLNHFFEICEKYKPNQIVLLGDIKHNIPTSTYKERKDVKNFLEKVKDYSKVYIAQGNHDGNILYLSPPEIKVYDSKGFTIGDIGFVHGHSWPKQDVMNSKQIIMAHTHPTFLFEDRLGNKTFEPCWVKGFFKKKSLLSRYPTMKDPNVLVMPAFNPLCGGSAVNCNGIIGSLGKNIDLKKSSFYLLDGTCLGSKSNKKT